MGLSGPISAVRVPDRCLRGGTGRSRSLQLGGRGLRTRLNRRHRGRPLGTGSFRNRPWTPAPGQRSRKSRCDAQEDRDGQARHPHSGRASHRLPGIGARQRRGLKRRLWSRCLRKGGRHGGSTSNVRGAKARAPSIRPVSSGALRGAGRGGGQCPRCRQHCRLAHGSFEELLERRIPTLLEETLGLD
jgi:hypothetical protein